MAAFLRPYGAAATLDGIVLIAAGAVRYQVNPALAAGDAKLSKDGAAFANLATLPAVTPSGGRAVRVSLSATEMECARAVGQFHDAAGDEWEDQEFIVETYGHASSAHPLIGRDNVTLADGHLVAAKFGAAAITSTVLADGAITAAKLAAAAITAIQNGLATAASIAALNNISAAAVNAEVDTALVDYGGPTKAELDAGLAALNDLSSLEIAALLRTALGTTGGDVIAELAQAQPAMTPSLADAVMLLYMMVRNALPVTAVMKSITNDAGTVICKGAISDDGTAFLRDKLVAGP